MCHIVIESMIKRLTSNYSKGPLKISMHQKEGSASGYKLPRVGENQQTLGCHCIILQEAVGSSKIPGTITIIPCLTLMPGSVYPANLFLLREFPDIQKSEYISNIQIH